MNFIEWTKQQGPEGPSLAAANQRPSGSIRERDRLTRIERMLRELVERRTTDGTQ